MTPPRPEVALAEAVEPVEPVEVGRWSLFEWMDQPWLPEVVRRGITDSLRGAEALTRLFDHLVPLLAEILHENDARRIVDMCSGAGGPIVRLFPELQRRGLVDELVLTDLYPHPEAVEAHPGVRYLPTPVDATAMPDDLVGLRTIFNGFHHFDPPAAQAILADAARQRQPILVVEALGRTPPAVVAAIGVAAFSGLVGPFYRPFRWSRLALTWLVPVVPTLLVWEGVVSCGRCYTEAELGSLVRDVTPADYAWRGGVVRTGWIGARLRWWYGRPLARRAP